MKPKMRTKRPSDQRAELPKAATGIRGLDEITGGGLPRGRPTLVCGGAGSGKTLLGVEFVVRGAVELGEPGVILTFEENARELATNVASLGFDLEGLVASKKIIVDYVHVERSEIEETGEFDLEGLFVRLQHAVTVVGGKRVLIDSIEALFSGISAHTILRAELRRLFRWLKDRGLTAIVTGERGEGQLTRHGLEEYISDCVILLDNRMEDQLSTRRLRVVKYRGTRHGSNEYPFLIDDHGFSVLPVSSLGLAHAASTQRLSTGVAGLDEMLGGEGYFRGSTILVSGTAGSGKSSIAAHLAASACSRGEKAILFSFEESPDQVVRNMRSIGLDLEPWLKRGLLQVRSHRPSLYGLEMHLIETHRRVEEFQPAVVVVDPVSDLMGIGRPTDVHAMLTRLIDFLKGRGVTALLTSLTAGGSSVTDSEVGISSLIDTWIVVQGFEVAGERNRGVSVIKSRGMAHSNLIREFTLSGSGISVVDAYRGDDTVLTGSARETAQRAAAKEIVRKRAETDRLRLETQTRIEGLRALLASQEEDLAGLIERDQARSGRSAGRGVAGKTKAVVERSRT